MNESSQKERVSQAIGGMLMAFPSSSNMKNEAAVVMYLMAIEGISPEAVVFACKAFVRGEVSDHNPDFAPSAPRLAREAKAIAEKMDQEAFWEKTEFVEYGSVQWRVLCRQRGGSMPQVERGGRQGWYVPKMEVAALPAQLLSDELDLLKREEQRFFPKHQKMGDER